MPLDYGISLEQDRLVCIVDILLERLDYSALQHLYPVLDGPEIRVWKAGETYCGGCRV